MRDIKYKLALIALLVLTLVSAAFAAVTFDRIVVTGPGKGRPGIVTSAPIEWREVATTVTASRTLSPNAGDHSGRVYRVAGTGAVTITLPIPNASLAGVVYTFINDADQTLALVCAGKIAGDNGSGASTTRNSASISTPGRRVGHVLRVVCTGSYWIVQTLTPNCNITWS